MLTVAAKDRGMYVAVRVKAELTQDDQYDQVMVMLVFITSTTRHTNARPSGAEKCERQVRSCESTSKVIDAVKEEPSNSMVDFMMHAVTRWQRS